MQIHELKPDTPRKKNQRIGRGGRRGSNCGRGMKGQMSRAGRKMQPAIRPFIKKYHKLRGYRFKSTQLKATIINVGFLNKNFEEGAIVSPKVLYERKLVRKAEGKVPEIKILGTGEINKKLTIKRCLFSKLAGEKIKKAGGIIR